MKHMRKLMPLGLLALLAGCATFPTGPSVNVLPAKGKSFEKFQQEDFTCRQWAERQLGAPIQEGYENSTATGAVAGTAVGAGVGAALGSASHHAGAGAAIGAATGLLFGTAIGSSEGERYGYEGQRRYDNAYVQCMYSYGNQVPGIRVASSKPAAPPPPPPQAVAPPPPPVAAPPQVVAPPPQPVAPPPQVTVIQPPPQRIVVVQPQPQVVTDVYQAPPELYLDQAPQFIYSPEVGAYVAVGVPYELVYTGNEYFYFSGGRWYRSPYYTGPWVYAPRRYWPAPIISYRFDRMRSFREMEYRRFMRDRRRYEGRLHRPEFRGRPRDEHRGEGPRGHEHRP